MKNANTERKIEGNRDEKCKYGKENKIRGKVRLEKNENTEGKLNEKSKMNRKK